jgi:uncharacterized membrane protein YhaH (DUF805 family)
MDWKYLLTSYEGRINRAKFWSCIGVLVVGAIIACILDNILGTNFSGERYGFLYTIYTVAILYSVFAIYAKRWHDRDKSGWWSLLVFVPIIGSLWMLIELGILGGTRGPNRFGADPIG